MKRRASYWERAKHFLMCIHNHPDLVELVPYLKQYILSFVIEDDVDFLYRHFLNAQQFTHDNVPVCYASFSVCMHRPEPPYTLVSAASIGIEYEPTVVYREHWGVSIGGLSIVLATNTLEARDYNFSDDMRVWVVLTDGLLLPYQTLAYANRCVAPPHSARVITQECPVTCSMNHIHVKNGHIVTE